MKIKRYDSLDGLRALACIGIILMHVQSNLAIKPSENFLTTNIIGFCGNLVLLFMMVSAFSLCCGYFDKFRNGSICIEDFYKKRWRRIWPFFALLVLIDVTFCFIKQHFTFNEIVGGELWEAFADLTLAFGLIPGNGIEVVGVGWFLGVIFLFYMLFPYFTFLIGNEKRAWLSMAVSLLLCTAINEYFVPVKSAIADGNSLIINCMPYFITGGVLYIYRERETFFSILTVRIVMTILTVFYTVLFFIFPQWQFPYSNLVMYALWIVYAISESYSNRTKTLLNNPVMKFISGISMEMYLCHMMWFRVVGFLHLDSHIEDNNILYAVTCVLVIVSAALFSLVWKKFEKKLLSPPCNPQPHR